MRHKPDGADAVVPELEAMRMPASEARIQPHAHCGETRLARAGSDRGPSEHASANKGPGRRPKCQPRRRRWRKK